MTFRRVLEHANIIECMEKFIEEMDYHVVTKVLVLMMVAIYDLDKQFLIAGKIHFLLVSRCRCTRICENFKARMDIEGSY